MDGYSHLNAAFERFAEYLRDVDPDRGFDLEEFGAWLDWEHTLRLKGSDTFSEYGNEAGLQLRWAIGKVLHDATPRALPNLYLDFAGRLTATDVVLTLNYDLLLERALEAVRLPFRRFPLRFSEIHRYSARVETDVRELVLMKLHGSVDWTYAVPDSGGRALSAAAGGLRPLVEGPRPKGDLLSCIAVIPPTDLDAYYASSQSWHRQPTLLMPPSTAKPMAGSPLVPPMGRRGLVRVHAGRVQRNRLLPARR